MRSGTIRRGTRLGIRGALGAVAIVVLTATQASAVTTGHYNFSATSGATFAMLNSNNLVNGTVDDALYYLSTTGTGLHRLPFALHLYNQTYSSAAISSNGNVQPGVTTGGGTAAFSNNCLPSATFGRPVVAPYWDDLFFDSNDSSHGFTEGVYLRTSGTAPHRKFTVSWQGHELADSGNIVLAQVIFQEGIQTVTYIYGRSGSTEGASATIGIQSKQQLSFTQFSCNSGNQAVFAGLKLTWLHSG